MNKNAFHTEIATSLSIEPEEADKMASGLVEIIRDRMISGDSIAIPGFGQFDTVSRQEQIVTDLSTGKRLMLPPVIEVVFTPATAIIKK
ncbi:MAG: HU family DNA-binding protein [Muribaculaceae bacterium]|nr:HU family DNA-binding protein [Muribaculaceae bacterium]